MINIYIQDFGSVIAVHIEADTIEEINQQYNSFYNWGLTGGDLMFHSDYPKHRYYIWSNKQKLFNYFYNVRENNFARRTGYEFEGRHFRERISREAQRIIDNLPRAEFLNRGLDTSYLKEFVVVSPKV